MYVRRVEPWFRRWGATDDEVASSLPVDSLVAPGTRAMTRAITVHAPIEEVWPWLVQIGQDRAGFYSYTWLENLVGAGMHNARSVHPEWQARRRGDSVWLAEEARYHERGRQIAALVDPPRAFVLVSPDDWERLERGEPRERRMELLPRRSAVPIAPGSSSASSGGAVGTHLFDVLHFVMEQKMMRGLRARVESAIA